VPISVSKVQARFRDLVVPRWVTGRAVDTAGAPRRAHGGRVHQHSYDGRRGCYKVVLLAKADNTSDSAAHTPTDNLQNKSMVQRPARMRAAHPDNKFGELYTYAE